MTQKDYQKAVCLFEPDPSVREQVRAGLAARAAAERGRQPRRVRPLRAALIAACVCLVLLGTAVAVQYFGVRVSVGRGQDWDVRMEGGITYYPVDILSEEVRALENERKTIPFGSWQEAEDFLGVDLMNNPVLDSSPAERFWAKFINGGKAVTGKFVLRMSADLAEFRMFGCYERENVYISVQSFLFTERMKEENIDWDELYYGLRFPEEKAQAISEGTYTTPNGLTAQLVTVEHASGSDSYIATFSLNGIPITVWTQAYSHSSPENAREVLYQVLDGFVLE